MMGGYKKADVILNMMWKFHKNRLSRAWLFMHAITICHVIADMFILTTSSARHLDRKFKMAPLKNKQKTWRKHRHNLALILHVAHFYKVNLVRIWLIIQSVHKFLKIYSYFISYELLNMWCQTACTGCKIVCLHSTLAMQTACTLNL
jgi:hypothetical protein